MTKYKRGDIHPVTQMKLWSVRVYKGVVKEDWRTQEAWEIATKKKKQRTREQYIAKKKRITDIKLEQGCEQCGWGKHKFPHKWREQVALILEFDHIDPATKSYNICDMGHKSWEKIQAEIDKCRILCKPCHTKHTGAQNRGEYYA